MFVIGVGVFNDVYINARALAAQQRLLDVLWMHTPAHKKAPAHKKGFCYTRAQREVLLRAFAESDLVGDRMDGLCRHTRMTQKQVTQWFRNKRNRG